MNARALDAQSAALASSTIAAAPLGSAVVDDEEYVRPATLREQPAWVRDAVLLSTRARALLERVRVVLVAVLNYWDHEGRHISIGGTQLHIDASGSYRRGF